MKLYAFAIGFDQLDTQGAVDMFESLTNNKVEDVVNHLTETGKQNENCDITGFPIFALHVNIGYIWFSLKEKPVGDDDIFFRIVSNPKTTTIKFIETGFIDVKI